MGVTYLPRQGSRYGPAPSRTIPLDSVQLYTAALLEPRVALYPHFRVSRPPPLVASCGTTQVESVPAPLEGCGKTAPSGSEQVYTMPGKPPSCPPDSSAIRTCHRS